MSFWRGVLQALGFIRPAGRPFRLNADLIRSLQTLAWEQGRALEDVTAELLASALEARAARRRSDQEIQQLWRRLTLREREVMALVCKGYTNRQIAKSLSISPDTVKVHARRTLDKFDLDSRSELQTLLAGWEPEDEPSTDPDSELFGQTNDP